MEIVESIVLEIIQEASQATSKYVCSEIVNDRMSFKFKVRNQNLKRDQD